MGAAVLREARRGGVRRPRDDDRARCSSARRRAGRVWLRSADPLAKPRILTNSLAEPDDVASHGRRRCEMAREIAATSPVARGGRARAQARRRRPGPPSELEAALRERLELIYHPVGTCRMSDNGEDAVVDSRASRSRDRRPEGRRRFGLPGDPGRQHARADDDGRRARRRPDPRAGGAGTWVSRWAPARRCYSNSSSPPPPNAKQAPTPSDDQLRARVGALRGRVQVVGLHQLRVGRDESGPVGGDVGSAAMPRSPRPPGSCRRSRPR